MLVTTEGEARALSDYTKDYAKINGMNFSGFQLDLQKDFIGRLGFEKINAQKALEAYHENAFDIKTLSAKN